VTADASQLTNLKLKPASYVTYGDKNRGRILGVGDVGVNDKVIIKDVLLVDGLKHSLLSISQQCDKGYKITFELNFCLIEDSKSSETVLVGKRINNVYMLNVSYITSSMNCLLTRNGESWLWHRRMKLIMLLKDLSKLFRMRKIVVFLPLNRTMGRVSE